MAITGIGFDGSVDEAQFSRLMKLAGINYALPSTNDYKATTVNGVRAVSFTAGAAYGVGVLATSDQVTELALPTPSVGQWHLLALRRDWAANTCTLVSLPGSSTTVTKPTGKPSTNPAGMFTTPGVVDDQPLYWAWVVNTSTVVTLFDVRLYDVEARLAALDASVDTRVGAAETRLDTSVNELDTRVDTRIDGVDTRIGNLDTKTTNSVNGVKNDIADLEYDTTRRTGPRPTMANNWTEKTTEDGPAVSRVGDLVTLRLFIYRNAEITGAQTMLTIPSGYRPRDTTVIVGSLPDAGAEGIIIGALQASGSFGIIYISNARSKSARFDFTYTGA